MQPQYPAQLPISDHRQEIIQALHRHQVIVIAGDTGSGKTTQLPKMCLEAGRGTRGMIGCTQPRRIAALAVAERVEEELGSKKLVGSKIRFQDRTDERTRIKFMTDGILLAEIRRDRNLEQYDTIIIDEAHERSLNIDFLLGCLHRLCSRRRDLKIIISSATIDTEKFSRHFHHAPIIEVSGRTYPITLVHRPEEEENRELTIVERAAQEACQLADSPGGGDILIFMPTERDILDTVELLGKNLTTPALVLPLYGRLHGRDQRRIFQPSRERKIIVATNVAETSITVPGIRTVIDTGLARIAHYNPRTGTTSLPVTRISRASCDQRAGRCGRTGPGTCIRLYSEDDYLARPLFTLPELLRSNLAEVLLQMISLGLGDPRKFPFIDPPQARAISDGYRILRELGAINEDNRLTGRGRIMAGLPLDPRISRMIIEGAELGALREVIIIAAVLSIQDPRIQPADKIDKARQAQAAFIQPGSDFLTFVNLWNSCRKAMEGGQPSAGLRRFCKTSFCSWQRMREWFDIHDQILRIVRQDKKFQLNPDPAPPEAVHQALTAGFLRNIGLRREKNRYQVSGGREVVIFPGSALYNRGSQWIVAADFVHTSQLFARTVARIDPAWLERLGGTLCRYSWSEPRWQKKAGQVVADERVTLFGMVIVADRRVNYGRINKETAAEAREIFIREALIHGRLGGRYPFLQHNLELVRRFEDMEQRTRRRGIAMDEEVLFAFYDQRLGRVYDRFTLNRVLKRKKNDKFLWMSEKDVCNQEPDSEELYRFPETLSTPRGQLRLHYRFQPGHDGDGVTVDIPADLYGDLSPVLFQWLVPGLLEDKIFFLLKGLPKKLRKLFVPLPDSVDAIMDGLDLYQGSLYEQLERVITRRFQLTLQRGDWQLDNLPPHLRMRFRLVDVRGKVLARSRSFAELQQYIPGKHRAENQKAASKVPEPVKIEQWDWKKPPQPISLLDRHNNISSVVWPALKLDKGQNQLELHYVSDRQQAARDNRAGLRHLYSREFGSELKAVRRECRAAVKSYSASWLSLGIQAKAAELAARLQACILDNIFHIREGELPDQEEFSQKVHEVRDKGLFRLARTRLDQVLALLKARREVQVQLSRFRRRTTAGKCFDQELFAELEAQLDQLVPADFLEKIELDLYGDRYRYLKALGLRIQRAEHAPHKDRSKAAQLHPFLRHLQRIPSFSHPSSPCKREIALFEKMIEEFRVSVFAPELGTSIPVSAKRLQKQWTVVENSCRTME